MKGVDVFFGTNVLIYFSSPNDAFKSETARRLVDSAVAQGNGAIRAQVMQECTNVLGGRY